MVAPEHSDKAIVLIHGIYDPRPFRTIWPGPRYFRDLESALADFDVGIHYPHLPNGGGVRDRGAKLASFLDSVPQPNLHLVAHSMGGLDARYVIHNLDQNRRVRSLTTIATPHRGTAAATWAIETPGLFPWIVRKLTMPGLRDLTPQACLQFNQNTPDRNDVSYTSYAGHRPTAEIPWGLRRVSRILQAAEGDNDAVVSRASATWGRFVHTARADHAELVGWNFGFANKHNERPFDHRTLYQSIVSSILNNRALREAGKNDSR